MINKFKVITILIFAIIIANMSFASIEKNIDPVKNNYKTALVNGGDSIDDAIDFIENFPVNTEDLKLVVDMYHGSLLTMKARDSWMPWNKLYYLNQGIDLMDDSLEKLENLKDHNPALLLESIITRALTNVKIPSIFNRSKLASFDLNRAMSNKNFIHVDNETKLKIYVYAALYAEKDNEAVTAKQYLEKAKQINKSLTESIYNDRKK
ncbi:hypothetical protein [uncultured Gammaproteobacteria bacterium]|nr:hypothetical protein [uncultured Gammaproteobacteria bacterium]